MERLNSTASESTSKGLRSEPTDDRKTWWYVYILSDSIRWCASANGTWWPLRMTAPPMAPWWCAVPRTERAFLALWWSAPASLLSVSASSLGSDDSSPFS